MSNSFNDISSQTIIVFVDYQVENYQSLVEGNSPHTEVIVLEASQDGIEQITQTLAERSNIESVQIISHGNDGQLQLGATELTAENISNYTQELSQWGEALTGDGDLLFLGCNVAASDTGKTLIQQLSQITGADIAASENLTGNANFGGDWVLEYATGLIDVPLALQVEAMETFSSVLETITVQNTDDSGAGSLRQAIIDAAQATFPGKDTIDLSNVQGVITLNSPLPDLATGNDIEFLGDGNDIISGNNLHQIISVNGANVLLSNLTLANGLAKGGDGINGGGGGLGAGGALYLDGGNVTVENVTFNNNQARGGNSPDGAGRGGPDQGSGAAGGNGGGLNGRQDGVGIGGGGGGRENNGSPGTDGQFGAGGGGGGGGGGGDTAPDDAGNGGRGGNGGFGGGGAGGGGGGRDVDIVGGDENGSGGAGGVGGEFGGNGGAGAGGGGSRDGGQGGGGAGLGGAIFVNPGASLSLIDANFNNNTAQGGTGANNGQGRGGAIFVRDGATVNGVGITYNGNSASDGDDNVFGTIGNLTLPTLQVFNLTNPTEPDTDGAFQLTLNQAFSNDINVNYSLAGTATENTDYTVVESVTIPPGQTTLDIPVTILDDSSFDPNETITLTLEPGIPNFYDLGLSNSATLTINDNEPEVSITAGTTPNESGTTGTFNINLTQPAPSGGLSVEYNITGTAIRGDDYTVE